MFGINEFKSRFVGGGARPSLFQIHITNPITGLGDLSTPLNAYSTSIPEETVPNFNLYYFGREIKYSGNRTFSDWTVEFYNDETFDVRNAMEMWMNAINGHESNRRSYPQQYKAQAQVFQYAQDGNRILKEYTFEGLFPINVSPIQLSWESDNIERFSVTFAYDLWKANGSTVGAASTS